MELFGKEGRKVVSMKWRNGGHAPSKGEEAWAGCDEQAGGIWSCGNKCNPRKQVPTENGRAALGSQESRSLHGGGGLGGGGEWFRKPPAGGAREEQGGGPLPYSWGLHVCIGCGCQQEQVQGSAEAESWTGVAQIARGRRGVQGKSRPRFGTISLYRGTEKWDAAAEQSMQKMF